jgi:hypothetical protein
VVESDIKVDFEFSGCPQGKVRNDDMVAVVSNYPQGGLIDTFHIAKVLRLTIQDVSLA